MSEDLPGMLAVAKGIAEQRWPHTMDAAKWASEFVKSYHPVGKDLSLPAMNTREAEELMLGWFANAIMAGYDTAQQRAAPSENRAQEGYPGIAHDLETMRTALQEIAKGQGAFSRDPMEHAINTIADMKAIAVAALEGKK